MLFVTFICGSAPTGAGEIGYVAMCSLLEGPKADDYRKRMTAGFAEFAAADAVARSVTALFPDNATTVLVRHVVRNPVSKKLIEHDTVRLVRRDTPPRFVDVEVDRDGTVHDAKPAGPEPARRLYEFAHAMAQYIYLNQLMADDRTAHRASCLEAMRYQVWVVPSLERDAGNAFAGDPSPDKRTVQRFRVAFRKFVVGAPRTSAYARAITKETASRLGDRPPFAIVYRDREPWTGAERDVVRVGTPSAHTYVMFSVEASGESSVGPIPICLTTDPRCGRFYTWP